MCEHNTSVVIFSNGKTTFEICEWGCGRILVYEMGSNGVTRLVKETEHPELSSLREKVERLEQIEKDLAIVISNAFGNGGAYMESAEADEIAAKYWNTWQDVSDTIDK